MDRGNLLISASGKGHRAITNLWINSIIGAIVLIGFGFGFGVWLDKEAEAYGSAESAVTTSRSTGYDAYFQRAAADATKSLKAKEKAAAKAAAKEGGTVALCVAAVIAVLILAYTAFAVSRIGGTAVTVYENAVCGKSVEHKTLELQLAEFELPYSQISSVDVIKNTVIINTANVRHKIYAMTASKIRDAIMSRKA